MNGLVIACAALLLNSAWLWAFADASAWYYANVALHPVLGVALAIAAIGRARRFALASPLRGVAAAALAAAAITGVAIVFLGATRPHYALVSAHVAAAIAGVVLLAVALRPRVGFDVATAGAAALFLVAAGAAFLHARHDEVRRAQFRIVNPDVVPASMDEESRGPSSPFYPSSADTNVRATIPANFFLTSETCGRCHSDIYEQWRSSMHHFSSFNNQWYRKSIEYMQDMVGTRPSKWCAGCHDHAVFFNGRFDRPIREQISTPEAQAGLACTSCHSITRVHGTMGQGGFEVEYPPLHDLAASGNPLLRTLHDRLTILAPRPHRETFLKPFHREQTSEFCSTCHKVHLDEPVNAYRWLRGFNEYDNWQGSGVSGEGARSFYYPPAPQGCADCHMPLVASADPAARSGRVHSHRFAAANSAVPFVNHDTAQLEAVKAFLENGQVTLDVFGLARGPSTALGASPSSSLAAGPSTLLGARGETPAGADNEPTPATTFALGEESSAFGAPRASVTRPALTVTPFTDGAAAARRGESLRLEVVARTRKVGHFFPAGTVDAFDVWLEVEAVDDRGRVLLRSGALENGTGAVDPAAHFYRSLQLDGHGNRINKRNAWATRSLAYVRLIPPGAADTIHYRLDVPADAGDTVTVTARLRYRKFSWWNTQWAYAGVRDPADAVAARDAAYDDGAWVFSGDTSHVSGAIKAVPQLPVIDMASATATIKVLGPRVAMPLALGPPAAGARERWNDYGIGLLLQGDIRGAEAAFTKVTEIEPAYADGWVNIARARIQEGDMPGAEAMLRKALAIDPALAKTHFFLGTALKSLGRYDEALTHLRRAAEAYPRDRVVMNQAGRVLFLQGRLREAAAEFRKVLAIDPEDLQAHYNLMLCYQGLGDEAARAREQKLFERFKADEASQAITGGYRLLNPDDNNERQQIHEHGR